MCFCSKKYIIHIAIAEAAKSGFKLLPLPPYSPDLTSSFILFPKLKFHLHIHFQNNDEVVGAEEELLEEQVGLVGFFV